MEMEIKWNGDCWWDCLDEDEDREGEICGKQVGVSAYSQSLCVKKAMVRECQWCKCVC